MERRDRGEAEKGEGEIEEAKKGKGGIEERQRRGKG